ncbi:MAG TPA: hypothetical protein VNS58_15995 [Puia sp.]|jgi:hypothetical protein|nr:hypothetical protein [Puia sp.]
MKKNLWSSILCFLGFILLISIPWSGPMLSRAYDNYYRNKIDKNGLILKAVVYKKNTYKGKSLYYSYTFDGVSYSDHDQSDGLFERYDFRDTVNIMIDRTSPENTYVIIDSTIIEKNRKPSDETTDAKKLSFRMFVKKFKPLHLPLTIRTSDIQSTAVLKRITGKDSLFINSGYPEETWAYGVLPDTSDNFQLIWLSPAEIYLPVLTTFSKDGRKISEGHLSVGGCGSDCCFSCAEYITVNKDLTVYSVDSIRSCTCDSSGPRENTMKKYIRFMTGSISQKGQIYMSPIQEKSLDQ